MPSSLRRTGLLTAALAAPLLLTACPQPEVEQSRTVYVRKALETPGEDDILRMEDERWTFEGKLKRYLKDPNAKVRRRAAMAAGRIRDKSTAEDLRALLSDKDKDVRGAAAFAAGLFAD